MLRIYDDILDWADSVRPVIRSIQRHDPDLARQLRRSSTSVCLNTSEGMVAYGASKRQCYRIALRELRESMTAIELAERFDYARYDDTNAQDRQQKILATLINLAKPRE